PSRSAAVRWLIEEHGFTKADAEKAVRKGGGKSVLGVDARRAVDERKDRGPIIPSVSANDIPTIGDVIGGLPDLADRLLPGNVPAPRSSGGGGERSRSGGDGSSRPPSTAPVSDADGDGRITAADIIAQGPGPSGSGGRGAALWPYQVPEGLDVQVEDRSNIGNSGLP